MRTPFEAINSWGNRQSQTFFIKNEKYVKDLKFDVSNMFLARLERFLHIFKHWVLSAFSKTLNLVYDTAENVSHDMKTCIRWVKRIFTKSGKLKFLGRKVKFPTCHEEFLQKVGN